MKNYDIDLVIPWVDGNDPEWIKEFNKFTPNAKRNVDIRNERYQDYGLLKYLFRGIEQNLPWVRKIHFITCGQKPDWLNLNCPKLNWVRHCDYIPEDCLPVFSSNPIELCLHRIPDLAEHFIYFNDDMFITKKTKIDYFFKNGQPCDYASFTTLNPHKKFCRIPHIVLNDIIEINKNFDINTIRNKFFTKWFSLKTPKQFIKNVLSIHYKCVPSISIRHFPIPYLKSTYIEVWNKCPEVLNNTIHNRFRNNYEDVNQWLFRYWQLCSGTFVPKANYNHEKMIRLTNWTKKNSLELIKNKYNIICINDDTDEKQATNFKEIFSEIDKCFNILFPNKSSFEL